jgi:hypothetical protein
LSIVANAIICLVSAHAQSTQTAPAQKIIAPEKLLPKILILPWQTPNVDPDSLRLTRQARDAVTNKLKETFSPSAEPLDKSLKTEILTTALADDLQTVLADPSTSAQSALAIIPVWTHFHDYELLGLVAIDAYRNTIRHFVHKLIPQEQLIQAYKNKDTQSVFGQEFATFHKQIRDENLVKAPEELAIVVREQAASRRINEIDRTTLNLLMGYQLATKSGQMSFTLVNPFATEILAAIHQLYSLKQVMRKPNRIIFTKITYDKSPKAIKLPINLNLGTTLTEAVFGKTIPDSWRETLIVGAKTNGEVELKYSSKLNELISLEQQALKRDDMPQIVKIRGAWAYVDKGRAWGLQMNDRLVIADGSGTVRGHVVGYYGPEMKLKSPRGYPIHEGAIIFIRKGQKSMKEGQALSYDIMKVPSP